MIITIVGHGRGKTTSAIGTSVRTLQAEKRVAFFQFLKSEKKPEIYYLEKDDNFFFLTIDPETKDPKVANDDLFHLIHEYRYCDLIVLDSVLAACDLGIINKNMLKAVIDEYGKSKDIYLTGRVNNKAFREWLFLHSDIASNIFSERHIDDSFCEKCQQSYPYNMNFCPSCGSQLLHGSSAKKEIEY